MVLRGTLGDFGLPDIFQLVGHQQKTGVLLLKDREIEVRISFVEGNVVKAEQTSRDKSELLGSIMVRAEVLTQAQLDQALDTQQRTLRRLGDILIEMNVLDRPTLKEFARLQTTETIYRLFLWKKGTYEFTPAPVDYDDQSYEPIRAENILMEGFRMVDEWPAVRKIIPSASCTLSIMKSLPPEASANQDEEDLLSGMADAFGASEQPSTPNVKRIGASQRRVFVFVRPDRTVQSVVDVSRMGEFETTKALASLVQNGFLRLHLPKVADVGDAEPMTIKRATDLALPVLTRVALYAAVAAAIGLLVRMGSVAQTGALSSTGQVFESHAVADALAQTSFARLRDAIETYVLKEGKLPAQLDVLVQSGLLQERDLRFPYDQPFAYAVRVGSDGEAVYQLALPL